LFEGPALTRPTVHQQKINGTAVVELWARVTTQCVFLWPVYIKIHAIKSAVALLLNSIFNL